MAHLFGWRVSILVAFVAGMLVTPADPLSMCLAAVGMLFADWIVSATLRALGVGAPPPPIDRI